LRIKIYRITANTVSVKPVDYRRMKLTTVETISATFQLTQDIRRVRWALLARSCGEFVGDDGIDTAIQRCVDGMVVNNA